MKIGSYIQKLRKEKDLSINQLALYSKVSAAHISRIERELRDPSPEILRKLAPVLKVSYEELMRVAGYIDDVRIIDFESDEEARNYIEEQINKGHQRSIFKQYEQLSEEGKKLVDELIKQLSK